MTGNGEELPSATIYEVAARAGVSIATVSRTFTDSSKVAVRTREAVLEAAQDLHYVPAAAARALAGRRTRALGAVLPHIDGHYYAQLLVGFEIAASQLGLSVVLALASPDRVSTSAALDLLGRVDGVAFMAPSGADDSFVARVAAARPTVTVARGRVEGADAIHAENREPARELTAHLLAHGRRRIGFVGRPEAGSDIAGRHRGCLDALEAEGLTLVRLHEADPVEEAGREVAERILRGPLDLDALVCGNDELALAVVARLTAGGVRVPEDIAVTGWDDTVAARYLTPGLTTVHQDVAGLGALAARRLAARIGGDPALEPVTVASHAVLRASCGCAPAA
jgi:LacI family transcriptional regulator